MKNRVLVFSFLLLSFSVLYKCCYLYNQSVIDEIVVELKEIFGDDLKKSRVESNLGFSNYYWKGENGKYCYFTVSVGELIYQSKRDMFRMLPLFPVGHPQEVSSPFDTAKFYKPKGGNQSQFTVTARERNVSFSITSNTRKYPNQIIGKLDDVFSNKLF